MKVVALRAIPRAALRIVSPWWSQCSRLRLARVVTLAGSGLLVGGVLTALDAAGSESQVEGTIDGIRPIANGGLGLQVSSGTNRISIEVLQTGGNCPILFSRIRVAAERTAGRGGSDLVAPDLSHIQFLTGKTEVLATNVAGLRRMGAAGQHLRCVAVFHGLVLATSSSRRAFAFQDDSGVAILEQKISGRLIAAGQEISLQANCLVEGDRVFLCDPPVVDNNDMHNMSENSGTVYLTAGKHPFRLGWFNREYPYGLEVYYQGPDLPKRRIPDGALFVSDANSPSGAVRWVNGLNYACYEGNWLRVPDVDSLVPATQGTISNFSLGVIPRINDVAVQFTGWVEVPREGIYTFSTISDDGSLMFIDEKSAVVEVSGTNSVPTPVSIAMHQSLSADQDDHWAQVEGTVTYASQHGGRIILELSSEGGRMRAEVADSSGASPQLLLNSRVGVTGICLGSRTADGQNDLGKLLLPGIEEIELEAVPPERWTEQAVSSVKELSGTNISPESDRIVRVRGKFVSRSEGDLVLDDGTGTVRIKTTQPAAKIGQGDIEALGRLDRVSSNLVLECAFCRPIAVEPAAESKTLPLLVTIEQIKRLNRDKWQRGYPVKIRGVITTVLDSGFFIQDSSGSIYGRWRAPTDYDVPRVGDLWEVEGTTFAEFAPNIQVSRATRLDRAALPEPLHPTWDQLINGSLDTEYVEVQGIITAVQEGEVTLLTRAGKVSLQLPDIQPQELPRYENALVRVRGCVMPARNIQTQELVPGRMLLANASISVDEPAPDDPFKLPLKHAADLLLFDSSAGAFQRVKIAGQIVHERDGQFFLMDGSEGLRVIPKSSEELEVGDLVQAVGFSDLRGPAPILRDAMLRRVGSDRLSDPKLLPADGLLNRRYDAALVRVRARLMAISRDESDEVLELQSSGRGFLARLKTKAGLLPALLPGSQLELTGVYAGQSSDLTPGHEIDSFELLLNTPADVLVLSRPSWWTLRHTMAVIGSMVVIILVGLIWIALLRRQVEERTNQLAAEIRRHELTERQREMEQERTRIAQDLHDDLGASLTQIRFLSVLESRDAQLPETTRDRMKQVSEKSREMVASLDEIVWAVNPANDLLPNLANYLCHFAEEFFRSTAVRCRLDVDDSLPPVSLRSEVRHNLYLAVREALNNIAKHSQATELWLRIRFEKPAMLCVVIEDNGRGFTPAAGDGGDGLGNMRARLEKIGGRFEFESRAGSGVICRLILPVQTNVHGNGKGNAQADESPALKR